MANKVVKIIKARKLKHERYHQSVGVENCPLHKKRASKLAYAVLFFLTLIYGVSFFPKQATAADYYYSSPDVSSTYATTSNWVHWEYQVPPSSTYRFSRYFQRVVIPYNIANVRYVMYWPTLNGKEATSTCPSAYMNFHRNVTYFPHYNWSTTTDVSNAFGTFTLNAPPKNGACMVSIGATATTVPSGTYDVMFGVDALQKGWQIRGQDSGVKKTGIIETNGLAPPYVWQPDTGVDIGLKEWAFALVLSSSTVPSFPYDGTQNTRIVNFTPLDNATVTSPVTFTMQAYVSPEDIGTYIGVRFILHNIDQNVLLLSSLSPNDFYLLDGFDATSSGMFYYSSAPTYIPDGNYRLEAQLERTYLGGWVVNPFSPINETISHQFIIGSSTFLGNLAQNSFSNMQDFLSGASPTSTAATAGACNPLTWNTVYCLTYMFVPSAQDFKNTILGLKDMTLRHVPWGYGTRLYDILSMEGTTSLPTFDVTLHLGAGSLPTSSSTLTFDPDDMLSGGASLAASITDVTNGKTLREIAEPLIRLVVGLMVLFIIVNDLLGMGGHESGKAGNAKSPTARQASVTRKEYTF